MESLSQQHSWKKKKCYGNHFSRGNATIGTAFKSQCLTKTKSYFLTYDGCRGFPRGSVVKNPPANAGDTGDTGLTPGLGRSPGVGNGNPLQSSCWEIPLTEEPGGLQSMGSQKSQTLLSLHTRYKSAASCRWLWLALLHVSSSCGDQGRRSSPSLGHAVHKEKKGRARELMEVHSDSFF